MAAARSPPGGPARAGLARARRPGILGAPSATGRRAGKALNYIPSGHAPQQWVSSSVARDAAAAPNTCPMTPRVDPAVAVLDTNVVLDWLLFGDARARQLAAAIGAGRLHWHATAAMRAEFEQVLHRPMLAHRGHDGGRLLEQFDRWARLHPAAAAPFAGAPLRCRDADDQGFIDLAVAIGAGWLLSRDRALLALARPARRHGLEITTPAVWAARDAVALAAA